MSSAPMADAVTYLVETWDLLAADYPNLHELPLHLGESLEALWTKITLNGTLPQPSADWNPLRSTKPIVIPPKSLARRGLDAAQARPYLALFVTSSIVGSATLYCFPTISRSYIVPVLRPLRAYVPLVLLPTSDRPLRAGEIRKEAVLVLGADGGAGRELALDMEKRGFVVVATVRDASDVEGLERRGRGNIKVLVLDDTDASSVAPFIRSLGTALSLRFPLHSSGDPFSRPTHTLALTTVINCLSLAPVVQELRPLEAMEVAEVRAGLGERLATIVGVLKGIMPFLRSKRPSVPDSTIVTLLPSTLKVALPFASLSSAFDAALVSILESFRRELALSSSRIRLVSLSTGFFHLPQVAPSPTAPRRADPLVLGVRLASIYAPALSRRRFLGEDEGELSEEAEELKSARRQGTKLVKLCNKVWNVVAYGRGDGTVGSGATTYRLVARLPVSFVDAFLLMQDSLVALLFTNRIRRLASRPTPAATNPPLPTPPAAPTTTSHASSSHAPSQGSASDESEAEELLNQGNGSGSFSFIGKAGEAEWRESI